MNNQFKIFSKLGVIGLLISLLSFFKIGFAIGSKTMFFSGINFILPLVAVFFSFPISMFLIFSLFFIKAFFGFSVLTMGIPTLISTLNWSNEIRNNKFIKFSLNILLPTLCIILFIAHPIAGKAFAYSFFWFIPIIIYFLNTKFPFFTALSSTFLAHAVGSIIWLYSIPMTASQWNLLIPVVVIERLIIACAMTLTFYALKNIAHLCKNYYFRTKLC